MVEEVEEDDARVVNNPKETFEITSSSSVEPSPTEVTAVQEFFESTIDVFAMDKFSYQSYWLAILIFYLQIFIYNTILTNYTVPLGAQLGSTEVFVSFCFASLALTTASMDFLIKVLNTSITIYLTKRWKSCAYFFAVAIEATKFVSFAFAAIESVSSQGDPVSIVLNATAIITVLQIDNQTFKVLKIPLRKSKEYIERLEMTNNSPRLQYAMRWIFLSANVLCLLLLYYASEQSLRR